MCVLLIVDDVYFLLIPNSSDQQCRKCSKVQQPGQKQRLPFHCVWNWSDFQINFIAQNKKKSEKRLWQKNLWKHLVSKYSQYFRIKWNDLSEEIMLGRFRSALYSAIGKFFIMSTEFDKKFRKIHMIIDIENIDDK